MKYILWFFILLLFSLFILGGYKAAVSHPDFPVPLFAMHTKTKEYEKGKYVSNYTYRFAKEEEGPSGLYQLEIAEKGWKLKEQEGLIKTYEKRGERVSLFFGTGEMSVIEE
ncbi:hypothetical protein MJ920_06265 [Bacillus velezensis]|uniref:hypothetical protein n=1 Tax=Bacillus velezensis TaxID=492670 RepID=UPI00241C913F|nr:hypothetical protein [Bacillus velezensis]MEC1940173.1 hypothetical protein [Bacillus velezensis]WFQ88461.1 hypothetical protein MJ920_06265 [Bacillus velezensis]WKW09989.1 hypothetical protein Q3Y59_06045 [Bacillus velezensis]